MLSIADIVDAVAFPFSVWRTLGGLVPDMRDGRPVYVAGNAAVSFRVAYSGERKMLKCYTRTNENLKAIYGAAYHAKELCVIDMVGRHHWVDCLLMDYVEGRTLDEAICAATTEEEFVALAAGFDRMACELLAQERAHGDLKPENIIVRDDGAMVAIDWDNALFRALRGGARPRLVRRHISTLCVRPRCSTNTWTITLLHLSPRCCILWLWMSLRRSITANFTSRNFCRANL